MSIKIDARGLNCPQPVILTKKAMDENTGEQIITLVDNPAALENVCKLAKSQGYDYNVESNNGVNTIIMAKTGCCTKPASKQNVVILVKSNLFGSGNDELGSILMKSFMYALTELDTGLSQIIFMNEGVRLTTEGSPVLDHLQALEEQGVQILSCGTCLDFLDLKDKLEVGQVTNMYTAMETLTGADKSLIF
ncbi:MAG TPA: sulfurtransferase-like selenium metabolism protein YedF [Syntrophomonadaceae bacterium]|nr:sulfurtransferase-like selenium metabolism protein YedF [Syntrophomonadaceae bacterium]